MSTYSNNILVLLFLKNDFSEENLSDEELKKKKQCDTAF